MLWSSRFWPGLADGTIDLTFRRWKRSQVVAGRPYRTPVGIIEVESVDVVAPSAITDEEARRSGYASAAELVADLRGTDDRPIFRIAFHRMEGPDPRAELAASDALDGAAVAELDRRLDRLDKASPHGPWTRQVLELIEARPAVRAGDLAESMDRERLPFKTDVRKLKNLGLTLSLEIGYRLSPRGEAYLAAKRSRP